MPQQHVVRFGPFALDVQSGELHKHGRKARLHGQPLEVLVLLLERPGELVTRDELRTRLWGAETFVDFEHGLHAAVNKLRAALNDTADHPRYIETIPRRGYRFIGAIEAREPTAAPSNQVETAPPGILATSSSRRRPPLPLPYALVILFAAVAIAVVMVSFRGPTTGSGSRLMIAVLPFENLSGDPGQEYFSDGLTDELITGLGQLDATRLGVIARTSVLGYKRTAKPVRQVRRELAVDYVLTGTVRQDDARIRVTAQLVRASDETHVWADTYDRALGDLLPVQTGIARAVAAELRLRLPGVDRQEAIGRQVGWDAHQAALRGRYFLEQRTADGIRKAFDHFERAIALEPAYAGAHVGLADAHILAVTYADAPSADAMERARDAVLRALTLEEQDPAAHALLGVIRTEYDWDWNGAEQTFQRAIAVNPNFANAHKLYAEYLSYVGRFEAALAEAELARRLDPLSVVTNSLVGFVLYRARQYERALEELTPAIELDPDHPTPYLAQGLTLAMLGRHHQAIAALQKGVAASGRSSEMLAQLAWAYGRAGEPDRARAVLDELQARARTQHVSAFAFSLAYTGLGEWERAVDALEGAYRAREWYLCVLKTEPIFDPLRGNARFDVLLRQLNLPS